jgi:hypothetical protein
MSAGQFSVTISNAQPIKCFRKLPVCSQIFIRSSDGQVELGHLGRRNLPHQFEEIVFISRWAAKRAEVTLKEGN